MESIIPSPGTLPSVVIRSVFLPFIHALYEVSYLDIVHFCPFRFRFRYFHPYYSLFCYSLSSFTILFNLCKGVIFPFF